MTPEGSALQRRGMSRRRLRLASAVLLIIAAIAAILWLGWSAPRGTALVNALSSLLPALSDEEARVARVLIDNYHEYRNNTKNWSFAYFGSLFMSAVLASVAALTLKLERFVADDRLKKDLSALFAMVSALLITLSTVGGFHEKWLANRFASAKIEQLGYEFIADHDAAALRRILERLQQISYERNEEVLAGGREQGLDARKARPSAQ